MTPNDKLAGEAIRAARQTRGYSYRRVDELSKELVQRDPERYERLPKTVLWNMETGGETFFLQRSVGSGKIRSAIEILFGGDAEKFYRETGLAVVDIRPSSHEETASDVPMYLEMETPDSGKRLITAPVSCDFALEVRTSRMTPILSQGQPVYCIRAETARPGEIAVLNIPGDGLGLATALPDDRYRYERTKREFTLTAKGQLYGIVAWMRPVLPV